MTARGMRRAVRPRGPGFTLLEVMVALAVLAAAFMALAQLGGAAIRNHGWARDTQVATLLARGKLAELEEKYEDQGFKDFDEAEDGSFEDQGHPEIRWKLELVRPDADLSPEQLVATLAGAEGGDVQELLAQFFGGGKDAGKDGGPTTVSATAGLAGQMLTTQMKAFGEQLKKSLRELRFTVSWLDGRVERSFAVTSHMVVMNPKAPGGARDDTPDEPPNLVAPTQQPTRPQNPRAKKQTTDEQP